MKALEGAFSVIMKTGCGTDGALHSTNKDIVLDGADVDGGHRGSCALDPELGFSPTLYTLYRPLCKEFALFQSRGEPQLC